MTARKQICVEVDDLDRDTQIQLRNLFVDTTKELSVYGTTVVVDGNTMCVSIDEREFNTNSGLRSAQLRQFMKFDVARKNPHHFGRLKKFLDNTVFTER